MKKDGFENALEEWTWLKFKESPTIQNRAVWRETKELGKIAENEFDMKR